MYKKGFTIIEVVVVFLLILGVTFLTLPKNLETTKKAKLISQWSRKYADIQYVFSVMKAQKDSELREKINGTKNHNDKEEIFLETVKPYLRITTGIKIPYTQRYMNDIEVTATGKYYFNKFYNTALNEIVGLKLINADCEGEQVCAIMAFDINGSSPPNTWGYDIFGINILRQNIVPFGSGINHDELKDDCSKIGSGVYCSYYYLMGGRFD
ncbi:MAG: hypothetical protein PHC64_03185 [Candidatus Gastranaerophilales bacterium]|nr:hypothetical protein [Candidatus Gastranaerophilales bacterium]